jgi:hypothetical protein
MCNLGNIKQVLSILLAVFIFSLHITKSNGLGIFITLCGGAYYTYIDNMLKAQAVPLPSVANGVEKEDVQMLVDMTAKSALDIPDAFSRGGTPNTSGRVSPRLQA